MTESGPYAELPAQFRSTAGRRQTCLAGAELVAMRSTRRFPRHAHDEYGIGLMLEGGHRSWSASGHVEASAGDVIAVSSNEMHDGAPVGGRARGWRMVFLSTELIAHLLGPEAVARELAFAATGHPPLRRLTARLFAAAADDDPLALEEATAILLGQLLCRGPAGRTRPGARASIEIRRALEAIHAGPEQPWTLDRLARLSGVQRATLIRRFAREVGITPYAYITQLRVRRARRAILAGIRLAEAADQAGFADQSHMTRAFKRQYGLPPARYRAGTLAIVQDTPG